MTKTIRLVFLVFCIAVLAFAQAAEPDPAVTNGTPPANQPQAAAVVPPPAQVALPQELINEYLRAKSNAADARAAKADAEKAEREAIKELQELLNSKIGPACLQKNMIGVFADERQAKQVGAHPLDPICITPPPQR